jgi:hypothetical protein
MDAAMSTTLIFPCSVPAGERYAEAARQRDEKVVAASSLKYDVTAQKFDTWVYLPSVHDEHFARRLNQIITEYRVNRVYCPVAGAYIVLQRMVADGRLAVPLLGEMPILRHMREHRKLMADAEVQHAFIQQASEGRSPLLPIEIAAVMRQSLGIYGESDETKIAAMMAIFADAPKGDIVEIGVLTGRSACVLALMAQRHEIGPVLAVDSWNAPAAIQRDSPTVVQDLVDEWGDVSVAFESFVVSLLPIVKESAFNFLAMPSQQAHATWLRQRQVETKYFGNVRYSGTISVLHIDGNHDYAFVREDCALWLPHLAPGGWLVLDDYVWLHGDGPRRVGDELLQRARDIQRAFVCGKALFIKFGG